MSILVVTVAVLCSKGCLSGFVPTHEEASRLVEAIFGGAAPCARDQDNRYPGLWWGLNPAGPPKPWAAILARTTTTVVGDS